MLLAVVLLYVGAVLGVNGIWLVGQARAAAVEPVPARAGAGERILTVQLRSAAPIRPPPPCARHCCWKAARSR
jgi:hypothetical protein